MRYLNDGHIAALGVDWERLIDIVEDVVRTRAAGDSASPIKTYLRYGDPRNRIIAMPAYVGGGFKLAGMKWVASFPGNTGRGLPRAHSAIVLNDAETGKPAALINGGLLNSLRAAAVSGAMLRAWLAAREPRERLRLGLIGWGPVGKQHLDMCARLLGDRLGQVLLYDLRPIEPATVPERLRGIAAIADDWRAAYRGCDIVATCTVSERRYIDEPPPDDALLLNVSLRDYEPGSVCGRALPVVDDWAEVCRENTDIERLHLERGLTEADVVTLADIVCRDALAGAPANRPVFFNPMGLGGFDIALAGYYAAEAERRGVGLLLEAEGE